MYARKSAKAAEPVATPATESEVPDKPALKSLPEPGKYARKTAKPAPVEWSATPTTAFEVKDKLALELPPPLVRLLAACYKHAGYQVHTNSIPPVLP